MNILSEWLANCCKLRKTTEVFSSSYVEDKVVEITYLSGDHCGNGLVVTGQGHIITCDHCLDRERHHRNVRVGRLYYGIEDILFRDTRHDLALIKIHLEEKYPYCYKIKRIKQSKKKRRIPVYLLTRRQGKLVKKDGYLINRLLHPVYHADATLGYIPKNYICTNDRVALYQRFSHYELDIKVEQGDSGGIIVGQNYELLGVLSLFVMAVSLRGCRNIHKATAARIVDAEAMIRQYLQKNKRT